MQTETRKNELRTVSPSARSVAIVFSLRRSVEGELSVAGRMVQDAFWVDGGNTDTLFATRLGQN